MTRNRRDRASRLSRRAFQATLAGVAGTGLAGCVDGFGALGGREMGFAEVADAVGFEYDGRGVGIGHGNTGTYVADYDNDGLPEVLAVGGPRPVLFDNEDGTLTPSGQLEGIVEPGETLQSALFFDHDGTGWEDLLLLLKHGRPRFLRNVEGTFEPADVGLDAELAVPTSAAVADATGNGHLDVFVAQMGDWANGVPAGWLREADEEGPLADDNGARNLLFWNDGGSFELATDAGIDDTTWSLATSFVDLDGDGRPDIHVANDFNRDVVYRNRGDRTFERTLLPESTDRNGMSSLVTDVTGDGSPDIFVTNIHFPFEEADIGEEATDRLRRHFSFVLQSSRIEGNNLLINDGDGSFADRGAAFGVEDGGWGWAALACDFDHDGDEELFHATQNIFRIHDEPHYTLPMYFERVDEDQFETAAARELGFVESNDRSAAMLDLQGNGAMDIAVGAYDGPFRLYENAVGEAHPDRNSLQVQLRTDGGAIAIGSTVVLVAGDRRQRRFLTSGSDYQSQSTTLLHFGLGDRSTVDELEIAWPDGDETTIEDIEANQRLTITPAGITERRSF